MSQTQETMVGETEQKRKKILFVQPEPKDSSKSVKEAYSFFENIIKALMERFDVDARANLGWWVSDLIEKALKDRRYTALITHVPMKEINDGGSGLIGAFTFGGPRSLYFYIYQRSLAIIRKIKEKDSKLRIIAYTGADDVPEVRTLFKNAGIDYLIGRSADWQEDLQQIESALEKSLL